MIHSTSTTMTPMTIQVTAVEDMESGSSEGDGLWPRSIYGAAGAKGSGAPTASRHATPPAPKESPQLRFSNADVGLASSAYLAGAVLGALFFGWLTDRLGRKRLFFITFAVYLLATASTALSWNLASFALFRFFTGAGIGGEYTAINSTIQELVAARYRGWTDLVINGSFWIGTAPGAAGP